MSVGIFQVLKAYIADRGEGNLRLGIRGLFVKGLVYKKDEQTVLLYAMTHIGDEEFFRAIVDSIPKSESIVLLEGVADSSRLSGKALDYSSVAKWLGTSYQDKSFDEGVKKFHDFIYADVDTQDLSPSSKRFLELLAKEDSLQKKWDTISSEDFDEEEWNRAEASFQAERNRKLLQHFDAVSLRYKTMAIPWGATHIDDFARAMEARSFTLSETKEYLAISFF